MVAPSIGTSARREPKIERLPLPPWAHREVVYWYDEWTLIRDTCAGEREVKARSTYYLPHLDGMDDAEYSAYLDRATFYPFTGRTAQAMSGAVFRREHIIEGLPERLREKLSDFSKDSQSLRIFAMFCAEEVIKTGRVGVLLDMPKTESTEPRPYVTAYAAENIVDWEYDEIDGRNVLVRVVLREERKVIDPVTSVTQILPQYRQLILIGRGPDRFYRQEIYFTPKPDPMKPLVLSESFRESVTIPRFRGNVFDYLPFAFIRDLDKAPMHDIARLNISHYRSYAHLEHGRFFTGFPIYYVESPQGGGENDSEFSLGSASVWVTPPGAKPGLLEMNGQGLKFLESALDQKEQQASALGGRMMGVRPASTAESNNIVKISERNEQCVLLKVTLALDEGFTKILRWWTRLHDVPEDQANKVAIEFNKDFLFDNGGAREFRAIQAMYMDGIIPIEVLYGYLRKNDVVPDWMSIEEFKKLLTSKDSFPGNTNFDAREEGFADAKSRDLFDQLERQIESDEEIAGDLQDQTTERLEMQHAHDLDKQQKQQKQAEKMASKIAAGGAPGGVPGGPAGGPPRPGQPPQAQPPRPGQPPQGQPTRKPPPQKA